MTDLTELMKFRAWAEAIGHYHITEGVDRYLAMLESLKEREDGS